MSIRKTIVHRLLPYGVGVLLLLAVVPVHAGGDAAEFDMNSWQTIIADDCRSFYDGCNNCRREPGFAAACTRKYCAVYQQPRCLDDQAFDTGARASAIAKVIEYRCAGDAGFSLTYNEYVQDDQVVRLGSGQVMLRDAQTRTRYLLDREPSASGERYADASGLRFIGKGDDAMLMLGNQHIYRDCVISR